MSTGCIRGIGASRLSCRSGDFAHVFGPYSLQPWHVLQPVGAGWGSQERPAHDGRNASGGCEHDELLFSVRSRVSTSLRDTGATAQGPLLDIASRPAVGLGLLVLRVAVARAGTKSQVFYMSAGSGIDLYAEAVSVELYGPSGVGPAGKLGPTVSSNLLDERVQVQISKISTPQRSKALLHTYGIGQMPVPPYATRMQHSRAATSPVGRVGTTSFGEVTGGSVLGLTDLDFAAGASQAVTFEVEP